MKTKRTGLEGAYQRRTNRKAVQAELTTVYRRTGSQNAVLFSKIFNIPSQNVSGFFFRMRPPMGSQKQSKYPELAWENSFFFLLYQQLQQMMGEPNDGELCSCDGFEFNARKLRMLPCGCYGCVTVKKCMKTQFSIYNRKMVYIIFQVCVYIYICTYPFLAVRRYTHIINIYIPPD